MGRDGGPSSLPPVQAYAGCIEILEVTQNRMLKNYLLKFSLLGAIAASAQAVPPWNNPARRTELRQEMRVQRLQNDKAVKPPLSDVIENHYLQRNPDGREEYFSRRTVIARPSQTKVPMKAVRDHDPDTGTYYYVPTRPY